MTLCDVSSGALRAGGNLWKRSPARGCWSRILEIVSAIRPIPACGAHVTQLLHEEDGEPYEVWRVDVGDQRWILKKAKEYEYEIYTSFFSTPCPHVPELLGTATLTVVTIFWKSS